MSAFMHHHRRLRVVQHPARGYSGIPKARKPKRRGLLPRTATSFGIRTSKVRPSYRRPAAGPTASGLRGSRRRRYVPSSTY